MADNILLPKDGKTVRDLAYIFVCEVWKYHRLPTDIISDENLSLHFGSVE